ncbi:MAG: carboxypeptidase-like regulatory domain-containing protein [Butyricimonas faecihominis]
MKDEHGMPLPGVTVMVNGASVGFASTTNVNGVYDMLVPDVAEELVFSFVGLKTQTVKINGKTEINVVLEEDVQAMDEVVVTGYQNIDKRMNKCCTNVENG